MSAKFVLLLAIHFVIASLALTSPNLDAVNNLLNIDNTFTLFNHSDYDDAPQQNDKYDFIIVGAGPAGCVLANRLTENPNWSVYLIEAGGVETYLHQTPVLVAALQAGESNWGQKSIPQTRACLGMKNNQCSLPRGKVIGGSSSINYMLYNRGNKRDFDLWAAAGNPGWSYKDVLPYFLKSESAHLDGKEERGYHNYNGPLNVENVGFRSKIVDAFVEGNLQAGYKYVDYNGRTQSGVSYSQANTLGGKRHSAFRAFIEPIRQTRKNLHIVTYAQVTKVLIDPKTKTAHGVKLTYQGKEYTVHARKEVILSSGAFNSPHLLMLSGVGPAENLKAVGVPVIKDLPVGQTFYDHISHFAPVFTTNTKKQTVFTSNIDNDIVSNFVLGSKKTPLSIIGGIEAITFAKVEEPTFDNPADWPDVEILAFDGSLASDGGTSLSQGANFKEEVYEKVYRPLWEKNQDHFTMVVMQFRPRTSGRVWLNSSDPFDPLLIDPNYFEDEYDLEQLLKGTKEALRLAETPAMKKIGTKLHEIPVPGCEHLKFGTDDYWRCSIRVMSFTVYHYVATCRMGPSWDPKSVVDAQLRVHGIKNLRVADTSIIPFPPTSHTNAASYMIGEKAADMIKASWRFFY